MRQSMQAHAKLETSHLERKRLEQHRRKILIATNPEPPVFLWRRTRSCWTPTQRRWWDGGGLASWDRCANLMFACGKAMPLYQIAMHCREL